MLFLKALLLPHHIARIIAIILLLVYTQVTGASPAVIRAVLMFSVVELGKIFGHKADSLNSLGVALLCLSLHTPSVLWAPGFQLSAAATAGIIVGQKANPLRKISKILSKNSFGKFFDNFILQTSFVTFCATLATFPFLAYHFQSMSPLAWLGNIIVVPLVSLAMHAGLFTVIIPIDFFAEPLGTCAEFFLQLAAFFTKKLSESSTAMWTIGPFPVFILILFCFAFALLPLLKNSFYRKTSILIFAVLVSYFLFETFYDLWNPKWQATILDVGQGDSIYLKTPDNKHFLFDTGNGGKRDAAKNQIIPYLRNLGVRSLDAVIITHADADHYGGLKHLTENFNVRELWISACSHTEEKEEWLNVLASAYEKKILVRDIKAGFYFKEKHFELKALHPQENAFHCPETNRGSITFLARGFNKSILLTGDLTKEGESEILKTKNEIQADILKLGHHGSKTSSSVIFLEKVKPKISVASSGKNNRFRHPSKEIVMRLDSLKIPLLNTAKNGSVFIDVSKSGLLLRTSDGFLKYFRN